MDYFIIWFPEKYYFWIILLKKRGVVNMDKTFAYIDKGVAEKLKSLKLTPRESYNEILTRILEKLN